ncbi:helix-turn-helix domain-containing protein [Streptomyces sp. NPDC058612]|uniref:helix-turn-helix domain-containing protein n=1 Tax=Streptomyces sp. NPDC058612 TaxID=3346555 RepID=UPI0036653A8C
MPQQPEPEWVLTHRRVIGKRVRAAREHAGLTQQLLGERAGIDLKTVHRIEYALSDPKLSVLLQVADALGLPLAQLVRP